MFDAVTQANIDAIAEQLKGLDDSQRLTNTKSYHYFKFNIKKLIKEAYMPNVAYVTEYLIKKIFPTFKPKLYTHWLTLADHALNVLQKRDDEMQKQTEAEEHKAARQKMLESAHTLTIQEFNKLVDEIVSESANKYKCTITYRDWLSYTAKISAPDHKNVMKHIGCIYINAQNVVSCSWTNSMRPKLCTSVDQAFNILIGMFRKSLPHVVAR